MNPFAALQVSDDEDQKFVESKGAEQKLPKKTHQQRKQAKQAKIREAETGVKQSAPVTEEVLPERVKEDPRKKRYHEVVPPKELTSGHYLDRRSGTGRADKPRKQGGGRGGIGNLHDELQKDKYIKEGEETKPVEGEVVVEEAKEPEKPEGITLDEYFRNKGIDVDLTAANKKEPVKKGEVNAQWIKKEKLTVLETKEDKKATEDNQKGNKKGRRQYNDKVGLSDNLNSELFGFNAQQPKPVENREPRENREQREPRQPKEHRQPRQHKQPREPRQHKQPRQPRQHKQPREHKQPRQPRENKQYKPREQRQPREHKEHKDQKGGQRGGNKGAPRPQQKVVLNLNDFPTL